MRNMYGFLEVLCVPCHTLLLTKELPLTCPNCKRVYVATQEESEDLDDALQTWAKQVNCEHDFSPLVPSGQAAWHCKVCGKMNQEKRAKKA